MYNSSFLFFGTMILLDVVYCIIKLEKTRFIVPYKESKVLQLAPTTKDFLITARKKSLYYDKISNFGLFSNHYKDYLLDIPKSFGNCPLA